MARTIAQIYDALNTSKASMEELDTFVVSTQVPGSTRDNAADLAIDVTSESKVAVWRLWLWIFAVGSWMVEVLFDRHTSHVTEVLESKRVHTTRWYAEECKKYQYGYPLSWIDDRYQYAVDDLGSRIIKYAAAAERNSKVVIKVAKDVGGTREPLSTDELRLFREFWSKWKDAGVTLEIISLPADQLKINLTIVRDRLVLDANNNLLRDNSINPVRLAIDAFGNGLEFDGILRLSKLVDAIQEAEGVIDVKLSSASHRPSGGSWQLVGMSVESAAGYFELFYNESDFTYQDNVEITILD
ncbi:MAG: hypothetical protein NTW16_04235 [Bacteroidetes bacterium]|nr:hypothetical protein [Bacteroidota bacterium]